MNKSNLILASVLAIIFTSILIIFSPTSQKLNFSSSIPSPTPSQLISPTPDPTIEWKTFTDTENGFTFNYPSTYIADKQNISKDYFVMLKGSDYKIETNDFGSKNTGSFYYLTINLSCEPLDILGSKRILYSSNNYSVYAISGYEGLDYKTALIKNKGLCYEFTCNSETKCEGNYFDIFNQILSTFKFINQTGNPTPTATSSSKPTAAKILTYNVPSTWLTTADDLNLFQISYDPNLYSPVISAQRISLSSKGGGLDLDIKLLPYDGGSRHSFISQNIGFNSLPSTQEIEYSYGGKSGLILYGVEASGSNTVGMIIANNSKAWLIESQTPGQQLIEKQISTLMLR